jgi:predicted ABC-type transport system involved in lysophospholipase L1 biosynthesis ATPase subunit
VENNWLRRRVLEKKNPSRPHICWGSLFCTNLTQPTGNLDSENSRRVIDLLKQTTNEYGMTLLMVTHDADIAKQANHCIHLVDGRIQQN